MMLHQIELVVSISAAMKNASRWGAANNQIGLQDGVTWSPGSIQNAAADRLWDCTQLIERRMASCAVHINDHVAHFVIGAEILRSYVYSSRRQPFIDVSKYPWHIVVDVQQTATSGVGW